MEIKDMFMQKRILRVIPFLILGIILVYGWYMIFTKEYIASIKHIIAAALFLANLLLYFIRFRLAVLVTGCILILATFNLLAFFPEIVSTSYFIKIGSIDVATPSIQWKPLLLLVVYCIVNFNFLSNMYLDFKERKKAK